MDATLQEIRDLINDKERIDQRLAELITGTTSKMGRPKGSRNKPKSEGPEQESPGPSGQ